MAASNRRSREEDGTRRRDPRILDRSVVAIPLLGEINKDDNEIHAVIIDVDLDYDEGRQAGRGWFRDVINTQYAPQTSFRAHGIDITRAVMDSGVDANHPQLALHGNVNPASPLHARLYGCSTFGGRQRNGD